MQGVRALDILDIELGWSGRYLSTQVQLKFQLLGQYLIKNLVLDYSEDLLLLNALKKLNLLRIVPYVSDEPTGS